MQIWLTIANIGILVVNLILICLIYKQVRYIYKPLIGVIGSLSTTNQLTLDILGTAVNRKLVGELSLFRFTQDVCLYMHHMEWHHKEGLSIRAISDRLTVQDIEAGRSTVARVIKRGKTIHHDPKSCI